MMKIIPILILSFTLFGCGTYSNFLSMSMSQSCDVNAKSYIYGGLSTDGDLISTARPVDVGVGIIDIPFSFLGDTLMLPLSIKREIHRQKSCTSH